MNKYDHLMIKIREAYNIRPGDHESEVQYKTRILYSLVGRMGLASLFDAIEDESTSIVHMQRRMTKIIQTYCQLYPEIQQSMPEDPKALSKWIYEIFRDTGILYHTPYRVMLSAPMEAQVGGICFLRGYNIEERQNLSGLGASLKGTNQDVPGSLLAMFGIDGRSLQEQWRSVIGRANWIRMDDDIPVEYLRMGQPFQEGYWIQKPKITNGISMLRTRIALSGSRLYYLYKNENDDLLVSPLPRWRTDNYEYRNLTCACLADSGRLPAAVYHRRGAVVYLTFRYLPPPEVLKLWQLYSWPEKAVKYDDSFHRICAADVFDAISEEMHSLGYEFTEV